ncbi:MAG: transposase [Chloroflexi bacterium]|nr:transposase [Chloroflexota bacterium]
MVKHGVWENTVTWKALFGQRTAVERAFSRLKGQRSLNHITVRGLRKVTVHCYLALIAMQVMAG